MEEDAVAIGKLDQALTNPHSPHIPFLKLVDTQFQQCSQAFYLFFVDPDVTRRARATITALRALEFETGVVPGFS